MDPGPTTTHRDHVSHGRIHKPASSATTTTSPPSHSNAPAHSSTNNGPIHPSTASSGASGVANPRSCTTCRKRKVKCDKRHPCSNCARAHIECVFPSPGRAPRKARKPPDAELLERLKRLEGVVKGLGVQVDEEVKEREERKGQPDESQEQRTSPFQDRRMSGDGDTDGKSAGERGVEGREGAPRDRPMAGMDGKSPEPAVYREKKSADAKTGLESSFGRLVVEEGRSRYVNNSYWASLQNEVEDLRTILNESSDEEEEDYNSPHSNSQTSSNHQEFLFGFSSLNVDMLCLHPNPDLIDTYWSIYKENVDPLIKILHGPTIWPKIRDAKSHLDNIPKGMEALMFAIYYDVVTTLPPDDCRNLLREEKLTLVQRYRFGLEQALARANFVTSNEAIVLQAFVMFLICLRRNDDAKIIWTLTGLVVRMAQTLGIHRDGEHFGLSPFETEMRRRLWWQVCILDVRASEDHGCDPTIVESLFDTKMPLNVNDDALDPHMTEFPEPEVGCTEMTFCLIRYEVANTYRRLQFIPPGPVRCNEFFQNVTLEQKEQWIKELHQRIEERYLQHCDMTVPLYWVTATVSRLILSKMWLMVYHPFQRVDGGASLPQETKDRLFLTSLENVEYSLLLESETRTRKWGWLFRTYVQWHAIAFLLSELCVRTRGDAVDRAWRAVHAQFLLRPGDPPPADDDDAHTPARPSRNCLWKPLRKLFSTARRARERDLAKLQAEQDALLGVPPPPPPMPLGPTPTGAFTGNLEGASDVALADVGVPPSDLFASNAGGGAVGGTPGAALQQTASTATASAPDRLPPNQDFTLDWLVADTFGNMSPPEQPLDIVGGNGGEEMGVSGATGAGAGEGEGEGVNWASWDDMVQEFNMELDRAPVAGVGAAFGGATSGLQMWY